MEIHLIANQELSNQQMNHIKDFIYKMKTKSQLFFKLDPDFLDRANTNMQHILVEEKGSIKGYLSLSCYDDEEMEIASVFEEDEFMFEKMVQLAIETAQQQSLKRILFIADQTDIFLIKCLEKLNLASIFSEYRMNFVGELLGALPLGEEHQLALTTATVEDRQLMGMVKETFSNELTDNSLERIQLAKLDNQLIATFRLNEDEESIGIYGFVVDPQWRGKGFGKRVLYMIIQEIKVQSQTQTKKIYLEVECDNQIAFNLYQSIGFKIEATIDYFKLELPKND
ncbi:GNAT family N-acetyltransferase [Carnobacterium gallinarum]|uniref:GNAT family N-acetyltransferase n=1 Tax=Carnobacterium gallinarum TaxID=2749 RepID=UPI00068F0C2C|nr:GNAT family N-acetyltransferase [Carnobacterium gallinarum]